MRELRSYVVRVYRQQAGMAAGTVQEVRTGRTVPFGTMEELWQAVRNAPQRSEAGSSRKQRPSAGGPDSGDSDSGSEER